MRTQLLAGSLGVLLALGVAGCGDDDGDTNNNQNNNNTVVTCGDNVAGGTETCDGPDLRQNTCATIGQGFTSGTLACNAYCDGWDTSACAGTATCGDDTAEGNELCDGVDLDGQDCTTIGQGFTGGTLACGTDCMTWDVAGCTGAVCGDDTVGGTELCDGADLDGQDCTTIGQGFIGGTLACNTTCDDWDTTLCDAPTCGDDNAEGNEVCDGVDLNSQTCTTIPGGYTGGTLACNGTCDGWDVAGCTGGPVCGDGVIGFGEQCDGADLGGQSCTTIPGGFTGGTLACSVNCTWDTAGCTGGTTGCGNGIIDGIEQCDGADLGVYVCTDGGFTGGTLACAANCMLDWSGCTTGIPGWTCNPGYYGVSDGCDCGCGIIDPDCGGDTTAAACQYCNDTGSCDTVVCTDANSIINPTDNTSCVATTCGDNSAVGMEWCDGTDLRGLGCTDLGLGAGTLSCNADCTFNTNQCAPAPACGDGNVDAGEQCDGANLDGQSCTTVPGGFTGGTLSCDGSCQFDTTQCTGGVVGCGNGLIEGVEQCDGADLGGYVCTDGGFTGGTLACAANCMLDWSGCTTGIPGWTCNPGYYGVSDGCDCGCGIIDPDCGGDTTAAACQYCNDTGSCDTADCTDANSIINPTDNTSCVATTCGDNSAVGMEWCDGTDLRGLGCTDLGLGAGTLSCNADCTFNTNQCAPAPACGDGNIDAGEQCDGANLGGQSCTTVPGGFTGGTLSCDGSCQFDTSQCTGGTTGCGNGLVEGVEHCDGTDMGAAAGVLCTDVGFTGGTITCTAGCLLDFSTCTGGTPGWTCPQTWYGDGDCDCGCGVLDSDCPDAMVGSCDYCGLPGSCSPSGQGCPGTINPTNNAQCI